MGCFKTINNIISGTAKRVVLKDENIRFHDYQKCSQRLSGNGSHFLYSAGVYEMIVLVGKSKDATMELIQNINDPEDNRNDK